MRKIITYLLVISIVLSFTGCAKDNATMAQKPKEAEYLVKVTGDRPYGVLCGNKGAIYMVTAPASGDGTLWKVDQKGNTKEFAKLEGDFEGNPYTDKSFVSSGMGIDIKGNIYIALGDRILKVLKDGKVKTIATGFSRCSDVEVDLQGTLFVADDKEDAIYKLTPSMEKSMIYKGNLRPSFVLTSLVFDKDYNYLYAREGQTILRFDLSIDGLQEPEVIADKMIAFDICMDDNNNIYASSDGSKIRKLDTTGTISELDTQELVIVSSLGIDIGKTKKDKAFLYIACSNGIIKVPIVK